VGSHVARALLQAGHTPRILRRPNSPLDLVEGLLLEHAIGDVLDTDSLDRAMRGCEWVFHVAAVSDYWRSDRIKLYLINVNGTANVLNAARRAGVKRVIFTSSAAALGVPDVGYSADEMHPFNLSGRMFPYAHSKHLAEQEALRSVSEGQDVVIVNPTYVFGPGDLNQIGGSAMVELARGNVPVYPAGGVTVIDVRDVAAGHLAAAEHGHSGERYLLGSVDVSHKVIGKLIADITHTPIPVIPVPAFVTPMIAFGAGLLRGAGVDLPIDSTQLRLAAKNLYYDCHKAQRELGEPQVELRQSLQDTYDWYVQRGVIPAREVSA